MRGAFFYSIAGYLQMAMGFVSTLFLSRLLDDTDFGLFGFGLTLMLLFSRVRLWGLNALIVAADEPTDREISTQFWISVTLSLAVLLLIAAAAPLLLLINDRVNLNLEPDVLTFALWCAFFALFENEGLASTPESMLARELKYNIISLVATVSIFLSLTLSVVLAFLGFGAEALLWGYGLKAVSYCVGVWAYAPRRPKLMFSWGDAKGLLGEGRFLLIGGLGSFLAFQYDDLAVGGITDRGTLGSYRLAYNISLVPMAIIGGVLGVANATYARVKHDRKALSDAVGSILSAVALVGLPASAGLALIAPEFVILYLTEEHVAAISMVQILLLYSLFRPLNDSIGGLATVMDRNRVQTTFGIVQSVSMLVLGTTLTIFFGANGAALAAGLTVVFGFILLYWKLLRVYVDINYGAIFGPALLAVTLASVSTLLVAGYWKPEFLVFSLLYKAVIFSVVYLLTLYLTDRVRLLAMVQQIRTSLFSSGQTV